VIRSSALAVAAATAAASIVALPAAGSTVARLPAPGLTRSQITPSSCPSRDDDVMAYSRRPSFTATAGNTGRVSAERPRMQFQVWDHNAAESGMAGRPGSGYAPIAQGRVAPDRPGGSTFIWQPDVRLPYTYQLAWRVRLVSAGEAVSTWSGWRIFYIDHRMPRIRECRVGIGLDTWVQIARQEGISVRRAIDDDEWLHDFYATAARIGRAHPKAYVDAAVADSHDRRAWIAFRADAPPAARARIERFRQLNPGSRIAVLTGRNYSPEQLQARMHRLYDLVGASSLVEAVSGGADTRTGAIDIYAEREPGSNLTDSQIQDAVMAELQAQVKGYRIVEAGNGVLAGPAVQPIWLTVAEPDPADQEEE
jgi:hypothetical protein